MFDAGQGCEAFLEIAVKILRAFLIVARKAGVGFNQETGARGQTGFDRSGFSGAANEQRGSREQRERKGNLRDHEWIARKKFPSTPHDVFAGLFLEVRDHSATGKLERRSEGESDRADDTEGKGRRQDRQIRAREPDDVERNHPA